MSELALAASVVLVVTFAVAGLAKLRDTGGTRDAAVAFGVPRRAAPALAGALPVLELGIALALVFAPVRRGAGVVAALVLAAFTAATVRALRRGEHPHCHCFGQVSDAAVSARTVARNVALMFAAVLVALFGTRPVDWTIMGLATLVLTLVALVVLVGVQAWLLAGLVRQHGEVLLRLEALEGGDTTASRHAASAPPGAWGGLPIGHDAPDAALMTLDGPQVSLRDEVDARGGVLVMFSDPGCAPCEALAPTMARWQLDYEQTVPIIVVSAGQPDAVARFAAAHDLRDVFVDAEGTTAQRFEYLGTPGAVIVDADMRIASMVAAGADAITELVHAAVESEAAPHPVPIGPVVGDAAPPVDGLEQFRGTPVVVLFWNAGCGFCRSMASRLAAWERDRGDDPGLLIVAAGDPATNAAFGFSSPMTLDPDQSIMRSFGVTGTPIGVLVDADGRVASAPLVGADEVLTALDQRQALASSSTS